MKKYIRATHDYNRLKEFYIKVCYNKDYKTMPYADLKSELVSILQQQAIGDSFSVDNRVLGGFRSSTIGKGYDFRKVAPNLWEEIFGDYMNLTDSELAELELRSEGFKRKLRW
jgi:hypothetical protein